MDRIYTIQRHPWVKGLLYLLQRLWICRVPILATAIIVTTVILMGLRPRAVLRALYIKAGERKLFYDNCKQEPIPKLTTVRLREPLESVYTHCSEIQGSDKCVSGTKFDLQWVNQYGMDEIFNNLTPLDGVTLEQFRASTVLTTGASQNHFEESLAGLASYQALHKCYHIVFWDLGLKYFQRRELEKICGLEIRTFPFDKYPTHVARLNIYAWKPLVVLDLLKEYSGVIWFDASIRFPYRNVFEKTYNAMKPTDGLLQYSLGHTNPYGHTHPLMYDFLPTDQDRLKKIESLGEGNSLAFFKTPKVVKHVLYWWWLCALTSECIAPKGHTLSIREPGYYIHRYDQSILGVLVGNLYNYDFVKYVNPDCEVNVEREDFDPGMGIKVCV